MGRDYWRFVVADSSNCGSRWLVAGGDFCFRHCYPSATWGIQRWQSAYLYCGGVGDCERQDRYAAGRVVGVAPFKALLVESTFGGRPPDGRRYREVRSMSNEELI